MRVTLKSRLMYVVAASGRNASHFSVPTGNSSSSRFPVMKSVPSSAWVAGFRRRVPSKVSNGLDQLAALVGSVGSTSSACAFVVIGPAHAAAPGAASVEAWRTRASHFARSAASHP